MEVSLVFLVERDLMITFISVELAKTEDMENPISYVVSDATKSIPIIVWKMEEVEVGTEGVTPDQYWVEDCPEVKVVPKGIHK
jgi:hypothetical protein